MRSEKHTQADAAAGKSSNSGELFITPPTELKTCLNAEVTLESVQAYNQDHVHGNRVA